MGRTLGLTAIAIGLVVTAVAFAGIVDGGFARSAGWRPFVTALGGVLLGVATTTWGGAKYAGIGARV